MNTEPQRLGKYELRERLGRGGMAEVWKAFDTQLRRYVAIKILHADLQNDPNFITRFEREAQAIASLHHPNIVQIHDFQISRPPESSNTIAYMVMDYVEGETLSDYIRNTSRAGKFPPATDIVHLFTAISRAVDYAHQKGMIHRDIKPANILLDKRDTTRFTVGEPVLTDFGIVKLLGASTGTMSGMWLGTPLYISPEQAQGHPGNERSDIYSLGCILYEICTGVQPFRGDNIAAIMMQHITSMPTSPALINPNIPPALSMVILRALAKDPAARFSSACSMTAALAEAFNLPIPAELNVPTYPKEEMYGPTYFSQFHSGLSQGTLPSSTPSQAGGTPQPSQPAQPVALTTPQFLPPATAGKGTPVILTGANGAGSTPVHSIPGSPIIANEASNQPALTSAGSNHASSTPSGFVSVMPPVPPSKSHAQSGRRGPWLRVGLIALILLIILGGLSSLFVFTHKTPPPPPATSQGVGSVRFISSGQLYVNNNKGLNDELQINLQNIHSPAAGKAYYAWLLGDTDEGPAPPLLLGSLPVNSGNVNYLFQGDSQHDNLLISYSRFLITEEDAQNTPAAPSSDLSAWRYAAAIPSTPNPKDTRFHFSMRDHVRHLLTNESTIQAIGLQGGLSIWFLRNIEEILKWSLTAKDHWGNADVTLMRQQLINILYYLDGYACIAPDVHNVPPGTPTTPENPTIASIARVALIEPCAQAGLGYVRHIGAHLLGVATAPGATSATQKAADQIDQAMNNVKAWLSRIRLDAVQLADMSDQQLQQQAALDKLGDLATQARYAYAGRIDPSTGVYQGGADWIYSSIQRLAVFNVTPCTSTTTACV